MAHAPLAFLIADGMADYPLAALGGRTPLEAAHTPHMDALAAQCCAGTIATIPPGMSAGSDVACMSLLGFNPRQHHTGRGPIEAAARDCDLSPNDIVWRLNLVSLSGPLTDRRMADFTAGACDPRLATRIISHLATRLPHPRFTLVPGLGYRHLLIERGGANGPASNISIRPPHDIIGQSIAPDITALQHHAPLAAFLASAEHELRAAFPGIAANALWPWGQGAPLRLPNFTTATGHHGAIITAVDLLKGLGHAAGMHVPSIPGATGTIATDYAAKMHTAIQHLRTGGDFVLLHVEAPDDCAHRGDIASKVRSIELFDREIVGPFLAGTQDLAPAVLIACDHYTPVSLQVHTNTPAPFILAQHPHSPHQLSAFSEHHASQTGVHINPGHSLLHRVIQRFRQ